MRPRVVRTIVRYLSSIGLVTLAVACAAPDPNRQSGIARTDTDVLDTLWPRTGRIDPGFLPAAEIFQTSDVTVWNGQRTVGGFWVAHPSASQTRKVRITNAATGTEIDGVLYRAERNATSGSITLSSDTALALGIQPGRPSSVRITGLRPKGRTSKLQRKTVETRAETELASHIARLDDTRLVQVSAAAMRGMGYATIFEQPLLPDLLSGIRAYPRPDEGYAAPTIRVAVRPASAEPMTAQELRLLQDTITGSGDIGAVISIPGFVTNIRTGIAQDGAHLELVDRDGLMQIWTTYYEQLSDPDRALMPLQPVYFLAAD